MKHSEVFIHDGNLAISVKNTPTPLNDAIMQKRIFGRTLTGDEMNDIAENELDFNDEFTILSLVEWIQNSLNFMFPGMDIQIRQAGRSGGWIEMTGNWHLDLTRNLSASEKAFLTTVNEPFFVTSHAGNSDVFYVQRDEENLDMSVSRRIVPVFVALVKSAQQAFCEWVEFKMRCWKEKDNV